MVPGGASYSVTDETFVVSDVFGTLSGGEVDSVYFHHHGVSSGLFGPCVSGYVTLSSS